MQTLNLNDISYLIIQAAIEVHRALGPGLLESVYRDQIVVEVKAIEAVLPVHEAQLLSYLRLMDKPLGLLINFNVPLLTDGVTRRMNGYRVPALHSKETNPDLQRSPT